MEQDSLTSEGLHTWCSGLRIIDLGLLAKQMHCKQCRSLLDLNCTGKEEHVGLASVLYILCSCGKVNNVYTGKYDLSDGGRIYEVNAKASVSMQSKSSVHHIVNFLALLEIPISSCSNVTLMPSISIKDSPVAAFQEKPPLMSSGTSSATSQSLCITSSLTPSGSALPIASTNKSPVLKASSKLSASSQSCEQRSSSGPVLSSVQEGLPRAHHSLRQLPKEETVIKQEDDQSLNSQTQLPQESSEPLDDRPMPSEMDKTYEKAPPKKLYKCPICLKVIPSSRGFLVHMARLHKEQNMLPDHYAVKPEDMISESEDSVRKVCNQSALSVVPNMNQSSRNNLEESLDDKLKITFLDGSAKHCKEEANTLTENANQATDTTEEGTSGRTLICDSVEEQTTGAPRDCPESTVSLPAGKKLKANKLVCRVKDCNKQFSKKDLYNGHLQKQHNISDPHECEICLQVFNSKVSVKKHISRQHTSAESKQITCKYCGEVQLNASRLKKHITANHPKGLKKTVSCEVCAAKFSQKSALKIHMHKHTGEKPYKCHYCDLSFHNSGLRLSHVKYIHTKERPFLCDTCGASFFRACNLRDHERSHTGERPFQCHVCAERFTKREYLIIHVRRHTGERPYKCSECSAAYSQRISLSLHRRKKHGVQKQERQVSC